VRIFPGWAAACCSGGCGKIEFMGLSYQLVPAGVATQEAEICTHRRQPSDPHELVSSGGVLQLAERSLNPRPRADPAKGGD
jgi:hypothetical protein